MADRRSYRGGEDIRFRAEYAIRIARLYRALDSDRDGVGRVLSRQLLRSGTSVGANLREAQAGESRADFIHKIMIAQKEARESLYWLELLSATGCCASERLEPLIRETDELIAILSAIAISGRNKN